MKKNPTKKEIIAGFKLCLKCPTPSRARLARRVKALSFLCFLDGLDAHRTEIMLVHKALAETYRKHAGRVKSERNN